jgi:hypothetical protein
VQGVAVIGTVHLRVGRDERRPVWKGVVIAIYRIERMREPVTSLNRVGVLGPEYPLARGEHSL